MMMIYTQFSDPYRTISQQHKKHHTLDLLKVV